MHPTVSYHLAQARTADLRHRAQRDALAGATRRARPGRRGHAVPRWPTGWRRAGQWGSNPMTDPLSMPRLRGSSATLRRRGRRPPARFSQRGHARARPMPAAQDPSLCTLSAPASHHDR